MIDRSISKSTLRKLTGCPGYIIDYLNDCGRLPVFQQSKGRGYPRLYHPDAIQIVESHLRKSSQLNNPQEKKD